MVFGDVAPEERDRIILDNKCAHSAFFTGTMRPALGTVSDRKPL
jgi:hypothetical protein